MAVDETYFDSSFLLKLYFNEDESQTADAVLRNLRGSALITKLTDVEVVSSLQRRLSTADGSLAVGTYLTNRAEGLFQERLLDRDVFEAAVQIAQRYAKTYRLRSLDILHLATALRYGVSSIATFDKDMREAAQALGLALLPA